MRNETSHAFVVISLVARDKLDQVKQYLKETKEIKILLSDKVEFKAKKMLNRKYCHHNGIQH